MSRARRLLERTFTGSLESKLSSLKSEFAHAAQKVYDDWDQSDPDYGDPEVGFGGICNLVAEAMAEVVNKRLSEVDCSTASFGDNHTAVYVWVGDKGDEDAQACVVDIPYHYYETGGGYDWKKIPNVRFDSSDVLIHRIHRDDLPSNDEIEYRGFESVRTTPKAARIIEKFLTQLPNHQSVLDVGNLHILMVFGAPVAFYRDGESVVYALNDRSVDMNSKQYVISWAKGKPIHPASQDDIKHVMFVAVQAGVA